MSVWSYRIKAVNSQKHTNEVGNTLPSPHPLPSDIFELEIERMGGGADSVSHLPDGMAVFIPLGAPGDRVRVEVTERKDRYARGRIIEVITPGPDRTTPPCPHFGACGGCDYQHLTYSAQLAAKRSAVVAALVRIGKFADAEEVTADIIGSKRETGYRNKIELAARFVNGRLTVGYHRRGTSELVEVDRCLLMSKKFDRAPKALAGALRYAAGAEDFGIERASVRSSADGNSAEVAIYTNPGPFPRARFAQVLKDALPKTTSTVRALIKGDMEARKITSVEVLSGAGRWTERVGDFTFEVSAPSFFQVNSAVAAAMVEQVLVALAPTEEDLVLDLYSGVGTFTLPLSATGAEVVAIESYGPAVRDLRRNLETNGLDALVVGGDAAREVSEFTDANLAVVDPPRAGLERPVVEALLESPITTLAYVSCDPATLARDLRLLVDGGYTLTSVTPYDMFPQTSHVENVAVLTRDA